MSPQGSSAFLFSSLLLTDEKEYIEYMQKRLGFIILGIAVAVVGGTLLYRSRSAESSGAAAHISEAGIEYFVHVLNSGACTREEVQEQSPLVQAVTANQKTLGTFSVKVVSGDNNTLRVLALGKEKGAMGSCHALRAEVESFAGLLGTKYRVASRDTAEEERCGLMPQPAPIVCSE